MSDDDDAVFDDTLDGNAIETLLASHPPVKGHKQRDLFGNLVPQSSSPVTSSPPVQIFPITHHNIDFESLDTYFYPTNFEMRDYQFNIVRNAFFKNLLVALPTGLGKTFIASTVMLNFHRWFPDSKIIFMAPTRPLVAQQIQSFCRDTGIPATKVATLVDKTRRNRGEIWDSANIFFTTPQVVENDLSAGTLDPKKIVLLVVDEAHRAKGNYAYSNVAKFIDRFNKSYRILALTATPASDVEGVQEVIDNLSISKAEVRTENSIDISKYLKRKKVERIAIGNTEEIEECIHLISTAISPILRIANERKIYEITDPLKINAFLAMEASQRVIRNPTMPEGLKWLNYFILQLLNIVGQSLRRLIIYGVRSFYSYFFEKHNEFTTKYNNKKSTNHLAASFYFHESVTLMLSKCKTWLENPSFWGHEKLQVLHQELESFFENRNYKNSKVIIFTEFRESALSIVRSLESSNNGDFKSHIFIGQAKEKDKFDEEKFLTKGRKKKGKEPPKTRASKSKNDGVSGGVSGGVSSSELAQARGMNQKMQKELIQKFKGDEFNILVATSIGEEGLDIGEVDLIVCYDSTSSPIKNIQRMGRTGRKRDGKVIMLFSSNEEQKFDKAMGGYEYIQQHIMNENLITLCSSDRIIPKQYTPIVKKVYIEIPDENLGIVEEKDNDEILRIATQYMAKATKTQNRAAKDKNSAKRQKTELQKAVKRFFMPDNVETGFTNARSLVVANDSGEKDILDSILESDSDLAEVETNEVLKELEMNDEAKSDNTQKDVGKERDGKKENYEKCYAPKTTVSVVDGSRKKHLGLRRKQPSILDQLKHPPKRPATEFDEQLAAAISESKKSMKLEREEKEHGIPVQPSISINYPYAVKSTTENSEDESEKISENMNLPTAQDITIEYKPKAEKEDNDFYDVSQEFHNNTEISKQGQVDRSEKQDIPPMSFSDPSISLGFLPETKVKKESLTDTRALLQAHSSLETPLDEGMHSDESDVFDDGLDEELGALAEPDPPYPMNFAPEDGFLCPDQESMLYSMYFEPADPKEACSYFDPALGFSRPVAITVGHSSKTLRMAKLYKNMHDSPKEVFKPTGSCNKDTGKS